MPVRTDLDGLRLKSPTSATIYLIDRGQKRGIVDGVTYDALFKDAANSSSVISDIGLPDLDTGPLITDGTVLVRAVGGSSVYLIDQNTKRHIGNPDTFTRYNFSGDKIVPVPPAVIAAIPDGNEIVFPG